MTKNHVLAMIAIASLGLAGCSSEASPSASISESGPAGLSVVVSTSILGQPISEIIDCVGAGNVSVLIPAGSSAHGYVPSSQQVAEMISADLVVLNGLDLEGGFADSLENAVADGALIFEVGDSVDPLPTVELADEHADEHAHDEHAHDDHADEHADEHAHGEFDPHFWFDMERVAVGMEAVGAKLTELSDDMNYTECANEVAGEIRVAEIEMIETLNAVPVANRKLVTDHEAFNYFAAEYGFELVGAVVPSTDDLANPSSAELSALAKAIKANNARAIFVSTNSSKTELARAVAEEVGYEVEIVTLFTESLGEPGSGADTYISMMRSNAETIVGALQ
jgi:zinc/manganese transport system substrate-binding protein